jgi:copper transport protein
MRTHRISALLFLVVLLGWGGSPAVAHQRLLGSTPAAGDTLHAAPRAIQLRFTEPVQLALTSVTLLGPGGRAVALGAAGLAPGAPAELVVPIEGGLRAGGYTVRWQTTGRDGHPVSDELSFEIHEDATGLAPPDAAGAAVQEEPISGTEMGAAPDGAAFHSGSPGYIAVRWVIYLSLLTSIGVCVFALLVLAQLARRPDEDAAILAAPARSNAALVGAVVAAVLLIGILGRLAAQAVAVFGQAAVSDPARALALLDTDWGFAWTVQAIGATIAVLAMLLARRAPGGFLVALFALLAVVGAQAFTGHAAAVEGSARAVALGSDVVHMLAAGSWLGTLVVLLIAGIPAAASLGSGRRMAGAAALVNAFSPIALLSAALLIATGVVLAVLHVGTLEALWGTTYGTTLLIKLALVVLLLGAGAYNFLVARPRLHRRNTLAGFRGSAGGEVVIAALILLTTAVLVAVARP